MESSFLNLVRGNRLSAYMGLRMDEGIAFKYSPDYTYIEIPVKEFWNPSDEKITGKALRNQHVRVVPACDVEVRGSYKVLVEPNADLAEYGSLQGMYYLHPGDGRKAPGFYISLRRDLDVSAVNWAVRLYMRL